ncbi:MAG: hypothetical protein ACRETG_04620 [Steroidobacteraceae bacterium]
MKKWIYRGADKADLNDVYSVGPEDEAHVDADGKAAPIRPVLKSFRAELVPGESFDAPDDWAPSPLEHPLFALADTKPPKVIKVVAGDEPVKE